MIWTMWCIGTMIHDMNNVVSRDQIYDINNVVYGDQIHEMNNVGCIGTRIMK